MVDVIIIIVGAIVAFQAYQMSILLGVLVSVLVLGIIFYRRAASLCCAIAVQKYGRGQKNQAMDWFERAYKLGMKLNEKLTYTYYLLREGRVGRCEEILNSMLAFRSQKPLERFQIKSNHAMLLMKTGRLYEAVEEYEEIFPHYKNTAMYGSLGFCYLVQGDMEKALKFNEEAYEYNGDDMIIVDNLMQTYAKLNRFGEAYELSVKLMEKKPAFREAFYDTAVVEYQLGKREDALGRLESALAIPVSFLTTVSDEQIAALKHKIESGEPPEGAKMVFLEAKSASLPDTPTLRVRPETPIRRTTENGVTESDDPISFSDPDAASESAAERDDVEPFDPAHEPRKDLAGDEDDGVFL